MYIPESPTTPINLGFINIPPSPRPLPLPNQRIMWPYAAAALGGYGGYRAAQYVRNRRPKRRARRRHYRRRSFRSRVRNVIKNRSEKKYHDLTINTSTPVAGTSSIIHLTDIDEGTDNLTRESDTIYINSIQITGSVIGDANVASDTWVRIILFRANDNVQGAFPIITDILMADSIDGLNQIDNRGDFTTYWNKNFLLPMRDAEASAVRPLHIMKYFKKFKKGKRVHYDGTGAGIADAEKGHWFLILMNSKASTFQPEYNLNLRVKFTEM